MVKIIDSLTSKGVTGFDRWVLVSATAVTPDGKVIAGNAINPDGWAEGWMVRLQ